MPALLSVVVPFHNVERYVVACLESLQRQTLTDLEVVLVDDGSTDGTSRLVEAFCATDDRFRVVRQDNQGLGPARNNGAREATGTYLTFVDSDDLVPRHAYEQMVGSLEKSGSDFAAGDARRFNDLGVRESYVHRIPFAQQRIATHVREFPELALDRMAWNKVYRRSFYDEQRLCFPAMLYEDFPVSVRAHVRARAVDVLSAPVYYWRERDGGELSITQRKWEMRNVRERVESAEMVLDFLQAEAPELLPVVEAHLLHIDVSAVAAALHQNDEKDHPAIFDLADRLHSRCSAASQRGVAPFERLQNHFLAERRPDRLKALVDYRARRGITAPAVRPSRWRRARYFDLPFFGSADVPRELYRIPRASLNLVTDVRDATWEGDLVRLELEAAVRFLPMTERSKVRLTMVNDQGREVDIPLTRSRGSREHFDEDLCVVTATVDPALLGGPSGEPVQSYWRLRAQVSTEGVSVEGSVRARSRGRFRMSEQHELKPGLWAQVQARADGLGLRIRKDTNVVTACDVVGSDIVVHGWYAPAEPTPSLRLVLDDGLARDFPVTTSPGDERRTRFTARVAAADLIGSGDHDNPVEEIVTWEPWLMVGEERRLLTLSPDFHDTGLVRGVRRLAASRTLFGNLSFQDSYAYPMADLMVWDGEHTLHVAGALGAADEVARELLVRRYVTPDDCVDLTVPVRVDGTRFDFRIDVQALEAATAELLKTVEAPGGPTPWRLLLPSHAGSGLLPVVAARDAISRSAPPRRIGAADVRLEFARNEHLQVVVA